MFAHTLIIAMALSAQADTPAKAEEVKPWERDWRQDEVVQNAPNPFDRFDETPRPTKPAGPLLLVRWPGAQPFTRLYATPAACGAAARTILLDYSEKERRVRRSGGILNAEPTAVCIPK